MYDLRTMLATYYTLSKDNAPTPEEMRRKSRDYMLMKPNRYRREKHARESNNKSCHGSNLEMTWKNEGSCTNCESVDHQVADCTTNKQGMGSLGYAPDEEHIGQTEKHEFYSGLIIKIGARCFFCNQEGHFKIDSPQFW